MDEFSTISQLISFLKSSFQGSDFEKVERVLSLKEEKMKELVDEIKKRNSVEKELGVSITRFNELFVEFEKKKMECNEIKGKFSVISGREKRANERIMELEMEIKKMAINFKEKFEGFKTEIRDLECGKIRAENKIEVWKKKCKELEDRVVSLEKEKDSSLKCIKYHVNGNVELDSRGLEDQICYIDEGKKDEIEVSKFQSKKNGSANHLREVCVDVLDPPIDINVVQLENQNSPLEVEFGNRARKQPSFELEESSDKEVVSLEKCGVRQSSVGIIEIVDSDDEKEIAPKHIHTIRVDGMLNVSTDDVSEKSSNNENDLTLKKCVKRTCSDQSGEKNESNCEEEEIVFSSKSKRRRTSKIVTSESESEGDDSLPIGKLRMKKLAELKDEVPKPSLVSPTTGKITSSSGCKNIKESVRPSRGRLISLGHFEEEKGSSDGTCKSDEVRKPSLVNPTTGKITSSSGCQNIEESVRPSRGRVISLGHFEEEKGSSDRTRKNDEVRKPSLVNPTTGKFTSSGCQNIEESVRPSRGRLISLGHFEEDEGSSDGICKNVSISPERLAMGEIAQEKQNMPTAENAEQNVKEKEDSGNEGGCITKAADSSDCEDGCSGLENEADDMGFARLVAMIKRNRDRKVKWHFEADMLSSFEEDPELCMKAVCALYRQQTSEGKSTMGSMLSKNRGFNKFDALRGTNLAEFLMDGNQKGDLKRTVKELEMYDSRGVAECQRLARHYSKQLFAIYTNKEDPFFLPLSSSTGP